MGQLTWQVSRPCSTCRPTAVVRPGPREHPGGVRQRPRDRGQHPGVRRAHHRRRRARALPRAHLRRPDRPATSYAELSTSPRRLAPIATLADLIDLLVRRGAERADEVGLNIETKFDVLHPDEGAPRASASSRPCLAVLTGTAVLERTSVQSFDWAVLRLVRAADPRIALNALTNTDYLEVDQPGASPWLGGLDIDDFDDSVPAAVSALGFDAISPSHTILTPGDGRGGARGRAAGAAVHRRRPTDSMRRLVEIGVDGMITNRPDLLREVLAVDGPTTAPPPTPPDSLSDRLTEPTPQQTRRALARAERGAALDLDEATVLLSARGEDLDRLCAVAARVRDAGPGRCRPARGGDLLAQGVHPGHPAVPRPLPLLHVRRPPRAISRATGTRRTSPPTRSSRSPARVPSSAAPRRCSPSATGPRTAGPRREEWLRRAGLRLHARLRPRDGDPGARGDRAAAPPQPRRHVVGGDEPAQAGLPLDGDDARDHLASALRGRRARPTSARPTRTPTSACGCSRTPAGSRSRSPPAC